MSAQSTKFGPPSAFKITESTQLEDWKKWQRSFRYYANSINLDMQSHDFQLSTFKSLIGPDAMEIYSTFSILDITDVESVMHKFDEHFKPKVNKTLERYKLYRMSQSCDQQFDEYLSEITNQVNKCDFRSFSDEIVLYKIVGGISNERIRNALLADDDLKYDKAVQICRASASSTMHFMTGDVLNQDSSKESKAVQKDQETVPGKHSRTTEANKAQGHGAVDKFLKANVHGFKISETIPVDVSSDEQTADILRGRTRKISNSKGSEPRALDYKQDVSPDEGSDFGSDWQAEDDDFEGVGGDEVVIKTADPLFDLVVIGTKEKGLWKRRKRRTKHSKGPPMCEVCGKEAVNYIELRKHLFAHSWAGKGSCHYCGKEFNNRRYMVRHFTLHHPETIGKPAKVYICDVCDYKTTRGSNLRRHKFKHTGERPYSCELCAYQCTRVDFMKEHMLKHTGEQPLCETCGKVFRNKTVLRTHMRVHTGERPVILTRERPVIQTGELPFACEFCDYRGRHKSAFDTHMLIHNNEKPFVCTVCGHAFRQRHMLTVHMLIHTGEKPYVCALCSAKFRQSAHLTRHMRVHTGEKPYACDICEHRWTTRSNLKQHMRVHRNQSGDPSEYSPPRKRKKKPVVIYAEAVPEEESPAIPQWSEQESTINPMEFFPNMTPSPFHLLTL